MTEAAFGPKGKGRIIFDEHTLKSQDCIKILEENLVRAELKMAGGKNGFSSKITLQFTSPRPQKRNFLQIK